SWTFCASALPKPVRHGNESGRKTGRLASRPARRLKGNRAGLEPRLAAAFHGQSTRPGFGRGFFVLERSGALASEHGGHGPALPASLSRSNFAHIAPCRNDCATLSSKCWPNANRINSSVAL